LLFERDRLQRVVSLRERVAASLAESNEQARIDEVRNTPVITVVDQPVLPAFPDRRRLVFKAASALVLGVLLGAFFAVIRDFVGRRSEIEPEEFEAMKALKAEAISDLRRFIPPFKARPRRLGS